MKPTSKFAIFLAIAGVLTILFALFPGRERKAEPVKESPSQQDGASRPQEGPKSQVSTGRDLQMACAPHVIPSLAKTQPLPSVNAPAIRGEAHYGWVRLPRGTPVELVRENGARLLVRWDGTIMEVPRTAVSTGALVLRQSKRIAARG